MNKLELSIELSFDIDAGTIELFDDDKLNTNRLVHPEVFFERYQNYKMDLKDKAYIDTTAQQVLNCPDRVFLYSDGGVCLVVHAECTFDIILNASEEIDERVLRRVVYANYAPPCFDGELLQLFNDVEIGKLEIEYR